MPIHGFENSCPQRRILRATSRPVPIPHPSPCGSRREARRRCTPVWHPRTRGNPPTANRPATSWGSIPASAGEPCIGKPIICSMKVYPRECGGTMTLSPFLFCSNGLSPRVRGNRPRQTHRPRTSRSIPASAGEPASVRAFYPLFWVYPRECGGTDVGLCKNCRQPTIPGQTRCPSCAELHRQSWQPRPSKGNDRDDLTS